MRLFETTVYERLENASGLARQNVVPANNSPSLLGPYTIDYLTAYPLVVYGIVA